MFSYLFSRCMMGSFSFIDTLLLWCNNSLYIDGDVLEVCAAAVCPSLWAAAASDRLWIGFKALRSRQRLTGTGDLRACERDTQGVKLQRTYQIRIKKRKRINVFSPVNKCKQVTANIRQALIIYFTYSYNTIYICVNIFCKDILTQNYIRNYK